MGRRGPIPKPASLRDAQGNPGRKKLPDRASKSILKTDIKPPSCPNHLSADAKREWRRILPLLIQLGLLSNIDRSTLSAYCEAYGRVCKSQRHLKKEGEVIVINDKGYKQQNPWLYVYNKALDQLHKFIKEFGLSPAARVALHIDTDAIDKPKPKKSKQKTKHSAKDKALASLIEDLEGGRIPAGGQA